MVSRVRLDDSLSNLNDPSEKLRDELRGRLTSQEFTTWFETTPFDFIYPDRLVLRIQNRFRKTWMEKKYHDILRCCARDIFTSEIRIDFEIDAAMKYPSASNIGLGTVLASNSSRSSETIANPAQHPLLHSEFVPGLHRDFVFDTFTIGCTNAVAHAAAMAVCDDPGRCYNPLLIYGEAEVGKTHLLHSICHQLINLKNSRPAYLTTEEFLRKHVDCVDFRSTGSLRRAFRETDVIVLDDVHFFAGNQGGQDQLFHIFNDFVDQGKQIILASRRCQKDWAGIQSRLCSRFRSGLVARIEPHGLDLRIKILLLKSRLRNIDLPAEVAEYMASTIQGGIRELEGALLRCIHLANVHKQSIDLALAQSALDHSGATLDRVGSISVERILRAVQDFYRLRPRDLLSRSKVRALAVPRQVGMFLARQMTQLSLVEIGMSFGGRDHTTVLYAQERIELLSKSSPQVREELQLLRERILGSSFR